jgi:hypothetical protein
MRGGPCSGSTRRSSPCRPPFLPASPSIWTVLPDLVPPLEVLAPLLVGLGLLRLRPAGATRAWLLVLLIALDDGLLLGQVGLVAAWAHQPLDVGWTAVQALGAAVGAFARWVPLAAWLDRDPPRRFWGLLALAFPLDLLAGLFGVAQNLAIVTLPPRGATAGELVPGVATTETLIGAAVTCLAIVAYAFLTPRPSDGRPGDGSRAAA